VVSSGILLQTTRSHDIPNHPMYWIGVAGMFVSTYQGRVDGKGRVSIPAPYRHALGARCPTVVVSAVYMLGSPCLAVYGLASMAALVNSLKEAGPDDEARQAVSLTLFPHAQTMTTDSTGRILLPAHLLRHAHLDDRVLAVGAGDHFHLWNPDRYNRVQQRATKMVGDAKAQMENQI